MIDPETGLTPKQKALCDKYIELGNGTQAALEVYDTEDRPSAGVIASRELKKVNAQTYIREQCKIAGLTTPRVLVRLADALDATRRLISPQGDDLGEVPDHNIRLRAVETSIKYVLPEFSAIRQGGGSPRHLHLHGSTVDDLRALADGELPE